MFLLFWRISDINLARSIDFNGSMTDWIRMHSMRFERLWTCSCTPQSRIWESVNIWSIGFPRSSISIDRFWRNGQNGSWCILCDLDESELVSAFVKVKLRIRQILTDFWDWSSSIDRFWQIDNGLDPDAFHASDGSKLVAHAPWRVLRTHPCSARMP